MRTIFFTFVYRCDEIALEKSFCTRVMVTRGETITKSLDPVNAALSRDALAKNIYLKLFGRQVLIL